MGGNGGYTSGPPMGQPGAARRAPEEFTTVFHSGTGGSHVLVLADRIITRDRVGHTSDIAIRNIAYAGAFESSWSPPAYGVYLVLRTSPYDTGYLFADAATRAAFLDTLRVQLGSETTYPPFAIPLDQAAAQ